MGVGKIKATIKPELFFALNQSSKALEKYQIQGKFTSEDERQAYLPFSCSSFALQDKLNKQGDYNLDDPSAATGLDQDVYDALRRTKPKSVTVRTVKRSPTFDFTDEIEEGVFSAYSKSLMSKTRTGRR